MPEQPASKADVLRNIRAERGALDAQVALLGESNLDIAGLDQDWSVKDVLAHIAAWERRVTDAIASGARGEAVAWPEDGASLADVDALNARDFVESRDRPLAAVLADARQRYEALLALTESLAEDALMSPPAWRPAVPLWQLIAANSWEHYREHIDQIEVWWAGQGA